nr:hypothetical protein [Clostridia bacterium]
MKKFTAMFLVFAMLGALMCACDTADDAVSGTSAQTTTNNLIQVADIEQNEVVIETAPHAWTVGFMEYPEDITYQNNNIFLIDKAYYNKNSGEITVPYYGANGRSYAVYDKKGNLLRTEVLPMSDKILIRDYHFTDYGYCALAENGDKISVLKYYNDTGKTETVLDDVSYLNTDTEQPFIYSYELF